MTTAPRPLAIALALSLGLACGTGDDAPAPDDPPADTTAASTGEAPGTHRGTLRGGPGDWTLEPCGGASPVAVVDRTGGVLEAAIRPLAGDAGGASGVYVAFRGEPAGPDGGVAAVEVLRAEHEGPGCERDPSDYVVVASGNEPFWAVRVTRDGIAFSAPGEPDRTFPPAEPTGDGAASYLSADGDGATIAITIVPEPCVDSMSGAYSSHRARVEIEGRALVGCASLGTAAR